MHFRIGENVYTPAALDRISLRNLIRLEAETVQLGRPMRWSELRALSDRVSTLKDSELEECDDFPWYLGMLIWAARLEAGEVVTFSEAIDFPMGDLEMVPDEGDDDVTPTPRKARPVSGRAAARRPADRKPKKASAKPSSAA